VKTRFTQLIGCSVPIQQSPMGPVSSPSLAIAVAGAGGLGTIPAFGVPAATSPRARVLRSCIGALAAFPGDTVGTAPEAGQAVALPRGSGRTPGESFTGCVAAMPMYASDAVESVVTIESAGQVVATLCGEAQRHLARPT
jgi:hypothetical protein